MQKEIDKEVEQPPNLASNNEKRVTKDKPKDNRPMTYEEKSTLSLEMRKLPPEKLGGVVDIIRARQAQTANQSDEIEIDLDQLDNITLRQLSKFVRTSLTANKKRQMSSENSNEVPWKLYYWPEFPGRGEFVRLVFAETGTPFVDVTNDKNMPYEGCYEFLQEFKKENNSKNFPFFAVPVIEKDGFVLSQTPAIVRYLAKHLDNGRIFPKTPEQEAYADSLMSSVSDVVEEGCRAWHAIDYNGSYESQKEATQPFVDYFLTKRLPRWLNYFEAALKHNGGGHGFLVGNSLTYVDLCAYLWLLGIEYDCSKYYNGEDIPLLRAFKERIAKLPRIAAWMASEKRQKLKFSGISPIF